MDPKLLKYLVQSVIILKEKLKCPICLDVITDSVELECSHRYCLECFSRHKATKKDSTCPLCKTVIKRRSTLYKDDYANSLGIFIHNICNNIRNQYNCEVEQLQKELNKDQSLKRNALEDVSVKEYNVPSTSKNKKLKSESSKENYEDTFNKLMNPATSLNKTGTRRVYKNNKKQARQQVEQENFMFVGDYDKKCILKWLHDTQNAFDRATQTQNVVNEEEKETASDLVSISQVIEKHEFTTNKSCQKARARSLDVEIKKVLPVEQNRKSLGGRVEAVENYDIEEINTDDRLIKKVEEKVLLDIIEDVYLNKLDSVNHGTELSEKNETIIRKKSNKWEGKGKIDRSIKKREKEKLNVTLQSTQTSKNKSMDKKKANLISVVKNNATSDCNNTDSLRKTHKDDKNAHDFKIIESTDNQNIAEANKPSCVDSGMVENVKGRSYDLHKIETYITNNMEIIEKSTSFNESMTSLISEKNYNKKIDKQIEASTKDKIDIVNADLAVENITHSAGNKESENDVLINIINNLEVEETVQQHIAPIQPQQNEMITLEDSDDEFHHVAQQKFTGFEKSSISMNDTLNILEEIVNRCSIKLNTVTPDFLNNQLSAMLACISKLKTFVPIPKVTSCDAWGQTNLEMNNVEVQTRVESNVALVQTEVNVDTVAIQAQIDNREAAVQTYFNVDSIAVQTEEVECFKYSDKEITNVMHSQNTKDRKVMLRKEQVNDTEDTIEIRKSKPSAQNEIFTPTFDNLNFDTQEVTKNQGIILRCTQKHSNQSVSHLPSINAQERKTSQFTGAKDMSQQLPSSVLICSLESSSKLNRVSRKLMYEPDKSKFKRIRAPTSDSDSDGEVEPKKVCNRFVRDDLTVEFQTNSVMAPNESQNSDNVNYDDYLVKVMKKYEDNSMSTSSAKDALEMQSSKVNVIKEIVNKCEEIVDQTSRNIRHIKEMTDVSSSSKDSFQTASQSINNNLNDILTDDNVFVDGNLEKLENDIRNYEKENVMVHNTESTDIIVDTDEIAPIPKKAKYCDDKLNNIQSASLFSRSEHILQNRCESENKICDELNDSFDDAELEKINICEEEIYVTGVGYEKKSGKINIINNVVLKSPTKRHQHMEEDDLFSDDDIVETTPQKKINGFAERSVLSEIDNIPNYFNEELPKPLTETENFEFDVTTLPPPLDFQDDFNPSNTSYNDTNNHTILNTLPNLNKSSLTPDKLSQFFVDIKNSDQTQVLSPCITSCTKEIIKNDFPMTPDKFLSKLEDTKRRKWRHSTPVRQRRGDTQSLGFSPIEAKSAQHTQNVSTVQKNLQEKTRQQESLMDLAQSSKYMPLSFVSKDSPKKHKILTSKPNQKSIWNYVQPTSCIEVEEKTSKITPHIACSRLTKDQIQAIQVRMVDKGLSTYCNVFNMSTTHMVVAVNNDNCLVDYTTKFVAAVAAGIWVLRFEWIEECLRRNCIVKEEPYEVLDPYGGMGPKISRMSRKTNPLFKGYKFYCAEPFVSITKLEIKDIITLLGGKVVVNMDDLLEDDGNIALIIKGDGNATDDLEVCECWIRVYKAVTVDLVWLSKCVGHYKVVTVRPYIMGDEEDNLEELNYPPHLLELVPLSLSETL